MYLASGFLAGIVLASTAKKGVWLMLLPIGAALCLTYSYAALIAVLAVIAGIALWRNNFRWRFLAGLVFVATLIIILQLKSAKLQDVINRNPRSSLASREMIWRSAGKMIQDNFVFGIGPGNFQAKYLEYQKFYPPYLEWAVPHPHNLFLAFWLNAGLIGLLAFLGLVIFWFFQAAKLQKTPIVLAAMSVMLYILLHGLADTTYFKNDLAIIFWLNFLVLKKGVFPHLS
jgi:O-antigen ligase